MKLFSTTTLVTAALAATLASCSSLGDMAGSMNPASAGGGGGADAVGMAKNSPVMYSMALPPGAAVGQSWTMDMSGMKSTYAIVAEVEGNLIVEQETAMYGSPIIIACAVDPTVDVTKMPAPGQKMPANVTAAWIGVEGQAPEEHKVMEPMEMPEPTGEVAATVDVKTGQETVSVGGRDWDTTWSEASGGKSWMAGNFIVRSDYNGDTVMQVSDWGTGAEPKLDWAAAE